LAVAAILARPLASVVALAAGNVAPAPLPGAVKVTVTPGTGLLLVSFTIATSGLAKAVLIVAPWADPEDMAIDAGGAAFVKLKVIGVETPDTVAVTL
jgi:hypothetical protein